jgi:hypothetical protein
MTCGCAAPGGGSLQTAVASQSVCDHVTREVLRLALFRGLLEGFMAQGEARCKTHRVQQH